MPEKEKFLPFAAINEFMRDDYRLAVITEVIGALDKIPNDQRSVINKSIARFVTVPGFRNSNLAPVGRKARASVDIFLASNDYSAAIIESWFRLHPDLAAVAFEVLTEKEWPNLQPISLDRSKLPGFQIHWPKQDTFEVLIKAVRAKQPFAEESDDNISLMVVWLGVRLPYDLFVEDSEEKKE
jgi:hypothetical protein